MNSPILRRALRVTLPAVLFVSIFGFAQENPAPQARVFVDFVSASHVVVAPGKSAPVNFTFRVRDPYHINSNKPLVPELIPTQLHFSLPGEVAVGRIVYPSGKLMNFPFDPSTKLSVYSGDVVIHGMVVAPLSSSTGTFTLHGELRYQACDNNACYPPKKLPFAFDIRIGAGGKTRHKTSHS